jgi:hypothetical protein
MPDRRQPSLQQAKASKVMQLMKALSSMPGAAVVTGVQIHSWGVDFEDEEPNLEFVAPVNVYVVVNGERIYLDLNSVPVSQANAGEVPLPLTC